jgi:hypothetical protein
VNKTILTDCDGVLLDWEKGFDRWIQRQGYQFNPVYKSYYSINQRYGIPHGKGMELVEKFNHGSDFEQLEPWRDSVEYVKRLAGEGWKFVVITTAGTHPWTHGLRWTNLINVFGEGVFESLHVLPIHGDKGDVLGNYKDSGLYWIEDKPSNAELGFKYGLKPLLMVADYNENYANKITKVDNWKEIYKIVTA